MKGKIAMVSRLVRPARAYSVTVAITLFVIGSAPVIQVLVIMRKPVLIIRSADEQLGYANLRVSRHALLMLVSPVVQMQVLALAMSLPAVTDNVVVILIVRPALAWTQDPVLDPDQDQDQDQDLMVSAPATSIFTVRRAAIATKNAPALVMRPTPATSIMRGANAPVMRNATMRVPSRKSAEVAPDVRPL